MGPSQYEPVGSSHVAINRLFTQFHANYPEHEWEQIVQDLVSGKSRLRLLFVTVAFGIGVDVNYIRKVIHIGVPHTIEEYFQEAARCGRDGLPASSTIYYNSYDLASSQNITVHMNKLVKPVKCKMEILLNYFGYGSPKWDGTEHACCDYHQGKCCCDDCIIYSAAQMMDMAGSDISSDISCGAAYSPDAEEEACISLTVKQKDVLKGHLLNYRYFFHGYGKSCVGSVGLFTGFTLELTDSVVDNSSELTSLDEVLKSVNCHCLMIIMPM